jgi:signal transduction histidine kinase
MLARFFLISIILILSSVTGKSSSSDSLKIIIDKAGTDKNGILDLIAKGKIASRTNSNNARLLLQHAEKIATENHFYQQQVDANIALGEFYFMIGKLDSAQYCYEKGFNIARKENIKKERIDCLSGLGAVFYQKADFPKSLEFYYSALDGLKSFNDNKLEAATLNKLAGVYYKLQDYPKALNFLKQSLFIKEEMRDSVALSKTYNNLGNIYADLNKPDSALYYFYKDLEISKKHGITENLAISYTNIASIHREKGDFKKSLFYGFEALKIDSAANDLFGMSADYDEIAFAYKGLHDYKKAESYWKKSLSIAKEIKADDLVLNILEDFSGFYSDIGNNKEALILFKEYSALKEKLINESKNRQIVEADKKYETQKKNIEIQQLKIEKIKSQSIQKIFLLIIVFLFIIAGLFVVFFRMKVKTNRVLNEKNEQLEQLNATQNRLMSIISHDLKAPLSAFYSITHSLKNKYEKIERQEIDNYFSRMLNSAVALKLQLENMLNWSINQTREIVVNKNNINLQILSYKVAMILQEFAYEKSIEIKNNITEDIEINTDGKLLSIVLNNLIANAVKFSPANSIVTLNANTQNKQVTISVEDKGVGMDEVGLNNLFKKNGNTPKSKNSETGLGLVVTKDIITKLGGKIWAKSKPGNGTTVFIKLNI